VSWGAAQGPTTDSRRPDERSGQEFRIARERVVANRLPPQRTSKDEVWAKTYGTRLVPARFHNSLPPGASSRQLERVARPLAGRCEPAMTLL